ncbi:MAG: aminotransferase class I/II-fold pyridoxal phosphate-dependent enzyme [Candidatus Ancillula sp.]|jgi:cystathionine beta-lyase|nr:aminotransferase class I/II-fold pyridoxal phosphate-dependent enzyme [Candidatus Ancillula sp.]
MNPLEQYSLEELQQRTSEKWRNYSADVLPLWVAEMDVRMPDELVQGLHDAISIGDVGYLSKEGFKRYAKAFCDFSKRHWGWEHDPNHIADVPDVVQGCRKVIDAYLEHNPQNSVIVSTPIYPPLINSYAKGYRYVDAPLVGSAYRLDFDLLEQAFASCTKDGKRAAYALCNPSNPSGTVHTHEELTKLAELSSKYEVLVVSDEIHSPLVTARNYEHDHHAANCCNSPERHGKHSAFIPYLSIPEADFAVCVCSASKAFSIPGMKAALVIPSSHMSGKAQDLIWHSGHFGQATSEHIGALAQTICLEQCDEWLYHLVQGIRNNQTYFESLAHKYFPDAKFTTPEGTYFAWVDFSSYARSGRIPHNMTPQKFFLEQAKVALNPGRTFATPLQMGWSGLPVDDTSKGEPADRVSTKYDNFVRINLATSQEIIRLAAERIGESLDDTKSL